MLKLVKVNKIIKSSIAKNKLYNKHSKVDSTDIKDTTVSDEALAEKFSDLLYEVFILMNKFYQI